MGRATRNPALELPVPRLSDEPPEVLNAAQAQALLDAANPLVRPYLALGLFAGLRPHEAVRVTKKSIRGGLIVVEGNQAKTRSRRVVQVSPNLKAWLDASPEAAWSGRGYWTTRDLVRQAKARSGVRFGQSALRHSFASHHLALHGDAARTALECGHSEQTLFRHYRELVTKEDAEAYFAVSPRPGSCGSYGNA
jgi:integrase